MTVEKVNNESGHARQKKTVAFTWALQQEQQRTRRSVSVVRRGARGERRGSNAQIEKWPTIDYEQGVLNGTELCIGHVK